MSTELEIQTPQSLIDKLGIESAGTKIGLSEARIRASMPELRKSFSFFRQYPDIYLDLIRDPSEKFSFYLYQRVFLRATMRHRYAYATFPRAYSKSFLSIMGLYLKCIFYPNSKLFIVSGGKEQSAKIASEKLDELWKFFPALRKELIWGRGSADKKVTVIQKDYIKLVFKNGSYLDIVIARDSARGGRRTGGLVEESAKVDGDMLSQVVIPMMNVSRRAAFGSEDPNDITNKSQVYVTTAGEKSTFPYDKMVQIFLWSLIRPSESICFGGTWRIPVVAGLLSENFVDDLKQDGTYSDQTFIKEYESVWGGGSDESFFSSAEFDRARVISKPFHEPPKRYKGDKLVIAYDVGRLGDSSSAALIHSIPQNKGQYMKKVGNIFGWEQMHFNDQANNMKRMIMKYGADKVILDANGAGIGLLDFMIIETTDPITGEILPAIGIDKQSDKKGDYKAYYDVKNAYNDIIYILKANEGLNTEMHNIAVTQISSGKVQFLIDDQLAYENYKKSAKYKTSTETQRILYMKPYKMTKILKEEMLNLKKTNSEGRTVLKRIAPRMQKDKFSAFEMGLWYLKKTEKNVRVTTKIPPGVSLASRNGAPTNRDSGSMRGRFGGGRFTGRR